MSEEPKWVGDTSMMVSYAFRYCLGRMTYAVSDCVEFIIANWDNIHTNEQRLMHGDIKRAIYSGQAGTETDKQQWRKVLALPVREEKESGFYEENF